MAGGSGGDGEWKKNMTNSETVQLLLKPVGSTDIQWRKCSNDFIAT